MIAALVLPQALRDAIASEAHTAFPRECCGLIEGRRDGAVICALAIHPIRNLAREPDRFELDPAEHFHLLRTLRGTGRDIVGCYHSHPNGRAELSPRDRASGSEDDFMWVVVGVGTADDVAWSCHAATGGIWRELDLRLLA